MTRALAAEAEIPSALSSTPYPDHHKVVNGYFKHVGEVFHGTILGAGGAGGTLELPFEPGYVKLINPAGTPRVRELFVGTGVQVDAAGAAATGLSVSGSTVTAATAAAADGETVQILAIAFRDTGGSE